MQTQYSRKLFTAKHTCLDKEKFLSWSLYRSVLNVEQSGIIGRHARITLRDFREINRPRNGILRQEKLSWRTVCMKDHLISLDFAVLQRNRFHVFLSGRLRELAGQIEKDWRSQKYTFWGSMVLVLAIIVTVCSFLNYPHPITTADTGSYFVSVRQLQATGNPVHPWRLPVYPLFIVLIYAVSGHGNLMAVSIVQGALFVLTALEFYILAALILKRGWLAFLISLFVSTNLILLSYSKPIMTEGLSLWLLTTLVLCANYFAKTLQVSMLWLLAICMLLLCFTRPEWLFFPIFLYVYLFFLVIPRKERRGMLLPILVSVITAA